MPTLHPVDALSAVSREFGSGASTKKTALLDSLTEVGRLSASHLRTLHDTLCFLRAYPDSARVEQAVTACVDAFRDLVERLTGGDPLHSALVNSGLPGTGNSYAYSYAVLQRMAELSPDLEIDWDEVEDEYPLNLASDLLIAPAEARGLEDENLTAREWLQACKRRPGQSDLITLLGLFENSRLDPHQQMHVFERCSLPVLYPLTRTGSGIVETVLEEETTHYQKRPVSRNRFRLAPWIRKPLDSYRRLSETVGQQRLDFSLRALCARNLEIYPLIYANPADVTEVEFARGLKLILAGVLEDFRTVPETLFFFMILKNGMPVAYGPASVFLGRCEMGINLFPEFRGGEIHLIYAEFMRAMHHLARARYFYITPYGMGVDNEEALRSGAFWFYRKMGFRPTNPRVDALAREEEAVMRRKPAHRSSRATLKRLSRTHVSLDLDGSTRRLDYGELSRGVTRAMASRFGSARRLGVQTLARELAETLEIDDYETWSLEEKAAIFRLAPLFSLIPGVKSWSESDRRQLARAIRAQGKPSELGYLRALEKVPRLETAFESLAPAEA